MVAAVVWWRWWWWLWRWVVAAAAAACRVQSSQVSQPAAPLTLRPPSAPQVCCFDKTGTLTTDHLLLEGLVGVPGRPQDELVRDLRQLPSSVAEVGGQVAA